MSNVSLRIGGRDFSVACASGEEQHVAMLGRTIDDKLRTMDASAGQGESRMLLFAALLLADELHELRQGQPPPLSPPDQSGELELLCDGLDAAAQRLENLAADLERAAARA